MKITLNFKELNNLKRKISNHKEMNLSIIYGVMPPWTFMIYIIHDFQIVVKLSQCRHVYNFIKYFLYLYMFILIEIM